MHLHLSNINVFAGRNSVGKSNIIDTLLFLRDCARDGIDHAVSERYSIDSVLQYSKFRPYHLEFKVSMQLQEGYGEYSLKLASRNREPALLSESAYLTLLKKNRRISFVREKDSIRVYGLGSSREAEISQYSSYLLDRDHLTISRLPLLPLQEGRQIQPFARQLTDIERYSIFPNTIRQPQKPSKDDRLTSSGDNITSILKHMSSSRTAWSRRRYVEIVSLMKVVIPNLDRILVRSISGLLWPLFEVTEEGGGTHQLNVSQISDGALRVLGILVALYQPRPPALIAIEEPEQNLHPGALGVLADAFKDVARESQVILTTHSPHLLDHFEIESIKSVTSRSGLTHVGPVSRPQREAIKEGLLSAGEVMTMQGLESE
jgi:predicted ATPase